MRKLAEIRTTLVMYNDIQTHPLGKVNVIVRNPKNSKKYNLEFVVTKGSANRLLGAEAIQRMAFIKVNKENICVCQEIDPFTKGTLLKDYRCLYRRRPVGRQVTPGYR